MCCLMLDTAFSGGAVDKRKRSAEGTESALSAGSSSSTDPYTLSEDGSHGLLVVWLYQDVRGAPIY